MTMDKSLTYRNFKAKSRYLSDLVILLTNFKIQFLAWVKIK